MNSLVKAFLSTTFAQKAINLIKSSFFRTDNSDEKYWFLKLWKKLFWTVQILRLMFIATTHSIIQHNDLNYSYWFETDLYRKKWPYCSALSIECGRAGELAGKCFILTPFSDGTTIKINFNGNIFSYSDGIDDHYLFGDGTVLNEGYVYDIAIQQPFVSHWIKL